MRLLTLLTFLFFNIGHSQDYYFKHYKAEDGLSHNTVLSSLQDKNGFMWFGTKNGLNRFDGKNFRLFQNNPDDPKSLQGNYIEKLHEFNGSLWVGTDNGLYLYNEIKENFDLLEGTEFKSISDIENDGDGNLWYIASGNVFNFNTKTKRTSVFSFQIDHFFASSIVKTNTNEIWIAATNLLLQYNKKTNSFKKNLLKVEQNIKFPFRINTLFNLKNGTIAIGTQNHGAYIFDLKEKKLDKLSSKIKETLYVRDFALKGKEELWIATESGIHIYNLRTKEYFKLTKDYYDSYSISDNAVYCLTIDHEGGIWAGTYFGGVNYYSSQYSLFKKYYPNGTKNSISGKAIREIHPDKYGNIWIGTEDAGLNKYNPKTKVFNNFNSVQNGGILAHYNIHGVLPDDDQLWVSSFDHGIDVLDIKTNKIIEHFNADEKNNLGNNFIFSLYKTRDNNIFLITPTGIITYDRISKKFNAHQGFPKQNFYTCFYEDVKGGLWAGTYSKGLFFYNPKNKTTKNFLLIKNNTSSISSNHINGIFQDSSGKIWVTTENGLNVIDKNNKIIKKYSTKDGFPSNAFYAILEEKKNTLWITTSRGLVKFNTNSKKIKTYTKVNGLLSDQFNYNSSYKAPDGTMYFGSVNGMISFNPKNFNDNSLPSKVLLTGLQINNKDVVVDGTNSPLKKSITFLDNLTLKPTESSFSLDFTTLSFTGSESIEYWYRMKGISDEWIPLNKNHKIYFTELPAGNYELVLKSLNNNGSLNTKFRSLTITVLPVFWKSITAYLVYILLCILLGYTALRYYHKRTVTINNQKIKELSNKKEKEVYQAKIEFFTNISHEIRTPLTLIKSPLDKLIDKVGNMPEIKETLIIMERNTTRLLDLVNELMDFRKVEMESISLTFVQTNFSDLLTSTHQRFAEAINDKNINLKLVLKEEDVLAFVDAEAIKKILSNLIGNAIKYAQNEIIITLETTEQLVLLKIQNDGQLIPAHLHKKIFEPFFRVSNLANQTGTGIGLALTHSLTKLHLGDLNFSVENAKWNTFILKIPIHQENEFKMYSKTGIDAVNSSNLLVEIENESNNKTKILLVEDSIDLLNFLAKDLSDIYHVFKAINGVEALKIIERENIQLIVTDVMMPLLNGYELCKIVKSSVETSHIPIIFLTSKNGLNAKIEGLESGADAYLDKPFSTPHLRLQISTLILNRNNILTYYTSSPLAHIKSIALTETDKAFINKLDEIILENISNTDLSVDTLSQKMNMSRSTLYRKIKEMSDLSPNELINITRLKKAAELLKSGSYKIYEISDMVGYNSQTSFGRSFQKQFNMTPTEYINS